jgi:ParB family chromosome partitioning protein
MGDERMNKLKPVLGRGLASLIPRPHPVSTAPPQTVSPDDGVSTEVIVTVELDAISRNPYQPRADFDAVALDELRQSIEEKGVIQPITVRRFDGGFQLISGERRVRAAREAGLRSIPAYVIKVKNNEEMLELALIENLQREHLNPIEVAISYKRLIEECSVTQEQVSQRIGKDRTTITNTLRLLKLPESIQNAVRRGEISSGHARALISIEDTSLQLGIFQRIKEKDLSVRAVEKLVQGQSRKRKNMASPLRIAVANSALAGVEERLRQTLGTKVQVKPLQGGRGEIVMEYYSDSDLERLLEIFEGTQDRPYL